MLQLFHKKGVVEAGLDEAGRGCLAGPVFAAAVILPFQIDLPELNDSKQLNRATRIFLRQRIEQEAVAFAVARVEPAEIDEINILNASFLAMHRSLDALGSTPEELLVDGNRFRAYKEIPHHCIIKGDGKYASIAAASILAKTYRDDYMEEMHTHFPEYGWSNNKGYPTKSHREAIASHGVTPLHRMSFRLLDEQLSLDF